MRQATSLQPQRRDETSPSTRVVIETIFALMDDHGSDACDTVRRRATAVILRILALECEPQLRSLRREFGDAAVIDLATDTLQKNPRILVHNK